MKLLFIEGDCFHEWDVDWSEFSAENCLAEFVKDREDVDDWSILDTYVVAGMNIVQIEDCEGETRKFIYSLNG
jgi:hypothetical protein